MLPREGFDISMRWKDDGLCDIGDLAGQCPWIDISETSPIAIQADSTGHWQAAAREGLYESRFATTIWSEHYQYLACLERQVYFAQKRRQWFKSHSNRASRDLRRHFA